jgi:hypothetical protein
MGKDFDIIIPHRGKTMGLWATIHSCEEDLRTTHYDYQYIIVGNGEDSDEETTQLINHVKKTGRLLYVHNVENLTPPDARAMGVQVSEAPVMFFFDNHCLVGQKYFQRAMMDFEKPGVDLLHSTTRFFAGQGYHYHYNLTLDYNFWAKSASLPKDPLKPYQLAAGGHGGFAVKRAAWDEVGGYGPTGLLRGYGGEEMLFDLKMWRYGKTNWIDPKLFHWHYAGYRGYKRHYTDDYYTNMMITANIIGGEKWLYKTYDSFTSRGHLRLNASRNMYDLLQEAVERSKDYAATVNQKSMFSLDELLSKFNTEQIAV